MRRVPLLLLSLFLRRSHAPEQGGLFSASFEIIAARLIHTPQDLSQSAKAALAAAVGLRASDRMFGT